MRLCIIIVWLIALSPFVALGQTDTGVESASGVIEIENTKANGSGQIDLQHNHITDPNIMARKGEEALMREDYANAISFFTLACGRETLTYCDRAFEILEDRSELELPPHMHITLGHQACAAGIQSGCDRLAVYLETADIGCAAEDADACVDAGMIRLFGKGADKEAVRGAKNYARACALGHLDACQTYGQIVASGSVLPSDPDAALEAFERSCTESHAHNCIIAGLRYADDHFESYEPQRAQAFFKKGCDYGDAFACEHQARLGE
ncbi:MAG: hypothetical protein AAGA72_15460 [Pseudomonadota bacterium]